MGETVPPEQGALPGTGAQDGSKARVAAMREVLLEVDPDKLARRLGLRTASAAAALRANDAALSHLAASLAEACPDCCPQDAARLARTMLCGEPQ